MPRHHNAVALAAAAFDWDVCQEGPNEYRMIGNVRDRLELASSRLFTVNIRFSEYGHPVGPNVELTEFRDVCGYVGREVNNYVRRVDEQLSETLSSSLVHGRLIPIRACSNEAAAIIRIEA